MVDPAARARAGLQQVPGSRVRSDKSSRHTAAPQQQMALSAVGDRPKAVSRAAAKQPTLALTDLLDLGFIQHDAVDCNAVAEHVAEVPVLQAVLRASLDALPQDKRAQLLQQLV